MLRVQARMMAIPQMLPEMMTTLIVVVAMPAMMRVLLAVSKGLMQMRVATLATIRKTMGQIVVTMAMTQVVVAQALMIATTVLCASQLMAIPLPVCHQK